MDLDTERLVISGAVGALAGYLLHRSPVLGALLGVGSALAVDKYMTMRGRGTGGSGRPPMRTLMLNRPGVVAGKLQRVGTSPLVPAGSTEEEVGWVGEEALDPIERAIYSVDHGVYGNRHWRMM